MLSRFVCAVIVALVLAMAMPAGAGSGAKVSLDTSEDGPIYLRLERFSVPVFRDGAVDKHLTFILVLELADALARDKAKELMPRVTDAFLRDLHRLASRPNTSAANIDLAIAKRHLLASSARVLGAGAVKDVLIERIFARPAG